MKTISEPSVISPGILVLALLAFGVIFFAMSGTQLPLLSNPKVSLAVLVLLGMTICAQGGIGRIAATGEWSHPLAIVGYILGVLILILSVTVLFNINLAFLANQQRAFLVIAGLIGLKVLNSFVHYYLLPRG